MKVTAIEEAQDISNMKLDELIGSLQTFESGTCEPVERKNKSITFVTNTSDNSKESNGGSDENLSDAIAMLGKQFNRLIKRVDQKSRPNVKDTSSDISHTYDSSKRFKAEEKPYLGKWVRCHGCEGFRHIIAECPTYHKEQKKGLTVTWSDEDSDSKKETAKHVTVSTRIYESDDDSSDDELTFDELAASYKKLCRENAEVCKQVEKQEVIIRDLEIEKSKHLAIIDSLSSEISMLNHKLDRMTKSFEMLNNGSDTQEEILEYGQRSGDMFGIGCVAKEEL